MEQPLPAQPAAPDLTQPSSHGRWTPARQRLFLTALLDTGNVSHAARSAGMSRSSAHRLRQRLANTAFDRNWATALKIYAERMADPFALETPPRAVLILSRPCRVSDAPSVQSRRFAPKLPDNSVNFAPPSLFPSPPMIPIEINHDRTDPSRD